MTENQVHSIPQRETYKLVEALIAGNYREPLSLLKRLVREVVNNKNFEITGGRVWELIPEDLAYELRMQYGNLEKIPDNYRIYIQDQPSLSELIKVRTMLKKETDQLLKSKGITLYSMSGVGPIIRTRSGKFYRYLLGFNAPEIKETFAETLSIISSVATATLKNIFDSQERKRIREDLYRAAQIQRSLLPDHSLEFHDYDIFGVCVPDSEVGGDYFDYLSSEVGEDERLGIVISDASSKGLSAAIQSLFVFGAIRMGMSYSVRMSDLISRLNKLIFDTFPYERFVTLFYCELTLSSNRLVLYVNAGHCAPIHYRPELDRVTKLGPTGGMLGLFEHQKFGTENIRMHFGDILVLYTDGIIEAMDPDHNLYGEERLIEIIRKNKNESARNLTYMILDDVYKFQSNSNINDDKTIVVIKRNRKE